MYILLYEVIICVAVAVFPLVVVEGAWLWHKCYHSCVYLLGAEIVVCNEGIPYYTNEVVCGSMIVVVVAFGVLVGDQQVGCYVSGN